MDSPVSVTFKRGKGFEEPWIVFHGSEPEVRQNMINVFGLGSDFASGLTLAELVTNCDHDFKTLGILSRHLGAQVVGDTHPEYSNDPAPVPEPEKDEPRTVFTEIREAVSKSDLNQVWKFHPEEVKRPEVMEALRARMAEITSAG